MAPLIHNTKVQSLSDLTARCIRCGFCLESCPTYLISGRENESPRGRIYLAKQAEQGEIDWKETKSSFDTCLGCRACEPACPSGVEYGKILEIAKSNTGGGSSLERLIGRVSDPDQITLVAKLGFLLPNRQVPQFAMRGVSEEAPVAKVPNLPKKRGWIELNVADLPEVVGEVYLLEGCAMRTLYPHVHESLRRLLRRIGFVAKSLDGCCGALHLHGGFHEVGEKKMRSLFSKADLDIPILVDSAGCGSAMKEHCTDSYGEKSVNKQRVFDAAEFLFKHGLIEVLRRSNGLAAKVTYHDACHLVHAQGIRSEPRELLQAIPNIEWIDLQESDVCCGSAGVYNLTQPSRARSLLDRKTENISKTGAMIVATGNPGCLAWIQQGLPGTKVRHTLELLEASFAGDMA